MVFSTSKIALNDTEMVLSPFKTQISLCAIDLFFDFGQEVHTVLEITGCNIKTVSLTVGP